MLGTLASDTLESVRHRPVLQKALGQQNLAVQAAEQTRTETLLCMKCSVIYFIVNSNMVALSTLLQIS